MEYAQFKGQLWDKTSVKWTRNQGQDYCKKMCCP